MSISDNFGWELDERVKNVALWRKVKSRVLRKLAKEVRFFVQTKGRSKRDIWVEARDEEDLLYLKEERGDEYRR